MLFQVEGACRQVARSGSPAWQSCCRSWATIGHVVLDGLQVCLVVAEVAHDGVGAPGCCHPAGRLVSEPHCQRPGFPALPAQLLLELKGLGGWQ